MLLVPSAAGATESQTTLTMGYMWLGGAGRPVPVHSPDSVKRVDVATGFRLTPTFTCEGTGCGEDRPARIEIRRGAGAWTTFVSGTISSTERTSKTFTSKKPAKVWMRVVLAAHEGEQEFISTPREFRFAAPTKVTLTGSLLVLDPRFKEWKVKSKGRVTVRLTPAQSGRVVILRDTGVEGWPQIARKRTNKKGEVTFTLTRRQLKDVTNLNVIVLPGKGRAPWQIPSVMREGTI